ncbi:hypothetical protein P4H83_06970 [Paenibacillus favisporus]|uniref:hypothetical protein n=1 Tax=Paenibacillus favisporus TaxID=221028 RepID=UPI002DB6E9C7|nr:hypothetical protein [Paenibacillus favisporus]MEC0174611.1 hypothetical protein [Paenibacillus favisporus]
MAILKDAAYQFNGCEFEIILKEKEEEGIISTVFFRFGTRFPELKADISCLQKDLISAFLDMKNIDTITPKVFTTQDPGLSIYYIPESTRNGIDDVLYRLIFVIDAGEINQYIATDTGPALCLLVTKKQINSFVQEYISEMK